MNRAHGTLAVGIAVESYASTAYPPLAGARADLEEVRRLFIGRGLPPSNILLLPGERATRRDCLSALRVWPGRFRIPELRLFLFFSGHGTEVLEDGIPTSVLLTHDADPEDPAGTGITIQDLAEAIGRVRPKEAYFFIDACEVGEHSESNRIQYSHLSGTGSAVSFGMFAAPGQRARENAAGGFFTQSVVRALSAVAPLTCASISESVARDLMSLKLPEPDSLLRGNAQIRPMSDLETSAVAPPIASRSLPDLVMRPEPCRWLVDELEKGTALWLWGQSGRGKTFLIRHFGIVADRPVIDISIPDRTQASNLDLVMEQLAAQIAERTPALFPDGRPPVDGLSGALIAIATSKTPTIVAVDHLDRLDVDDRSELTHILVGAMPAMLVLVGRTPPPPNLRVRILEAPRLSDTDIAHFAAQYGSGFGDLSVPALQLVSDGSPLRLRDFLASQAEGTQGWIDRQLSVDERAALSAIVSSGGFADVETYSEHMQVDRVAIRQLIARGFIQLSDECYVAHDSILELGSFDLSPDLDRRALDYWTHEILASMLTPRASREIVRLLATVERNQRVLIALPDVVEELRMARDWQSLGSLAEIFTRTASTQSDQWAQAVLAIASVFVRSTRHREASLLLSILRDSPIEASDQIRNQISILESERLWWHGSFTEAIVLITPVIESAPSPQALLSRGIAHWFLGNWDNADHDLNLVLHDDEADDRDIGWSQIMLASSLGLRGMDLPHVRSLFRDGIGRLSRSADDIGVAIGWGNFGEISWKLGDFEAAELQLRRGLAHAHEVCGPQLVLEMYRSVLEVSLRLHGPWSTEVSRALETARSLYDDSMGITVQMQLWNTLATIESMRGNVGESRRLVELLMPITEGNAEYHAYTLANASIVNLLQERLAEARMHMYGAFEICRVGGNNLALSQILGNLRMLRTISGDLSETQFALLDELTDWSARHGN